MGRTRQQSDARPPGALVGWLAATCLVVAGALGGPAWAAPNFPALTGRVVDTANVIPPDVEATLSGKLADLEQKTSRQLVVVTVPDLQDEDIADYGYQLGRAWGIGQKPLNNGALFIIAPKERKTRIEVGYGLEPILTDALSSVILNRAVLPKFKGGDLPGGIVAGTDALIEQLSLDPSEAEQRAAAAKQQVSGTQDQGASDIGWGAIITLVIVFLVFSRLFRRRRGGFPWWLLFLGGGGGGGGGSSWSSGGGGSSWGGGGEGGGFSGGGGSFGGGGSSGSW